MRTRTRREFLKYGMGAGTALMLANGCNVLRFGSPRINAQAVAKLRSRFGGSLILPGDAAFESARQGLWRNPSDDGRPALLARCASADDVKRSIEFAVEHQLPIAVRGGGHSYAGWSTCDDGVVIDVSLMKQIVVDPASRTARVGAGVLGGELVARAGRHGLAPVVGQCPTVCVSGLALGGGLGWLSGLYGATCDNLLEAQIVSPDKGLLTANAEQKSELFWALRGGGGNFGVSTSFVHMLHPLTTVTVGRLVYDFRDARPVIRTFGEVMAGAPDGFQATAVIGKVEEELMVYIAMVDSVESRESRACIRALRTISNPVADTVKSMAYADTFGNTYLFDPVNVSTFSTTKGLYLRALTPDVVEQVLDLVLQNPGPYAWVGLDHYMHGAVSRVPKNATSFELREAGALHVWISADSNDPAHARQQSDWIRKTWKTLQPYSAGRAYANYPGADDGKDSRTVYRDNYSRLAAVKARYDSDNVLRRNFNITPRA